MDHLTALLVSDDLALQPAEGIGPHPSEHFSDLRGEDDDQGDHPGRKHSAEHRLHGEKVEYRADSVRRRPDRDPDQISGQAPLAKKYVYEEQNGGKVYDIEDIEEIDRRKPRGDIVEEVLETIEPPGKQKRNPHG